jgi:hypothetical protein
VAFGRTRCTCCGIIVKSDITITRILDKYKREKKDNIFEFLKKNYTNLKRFLNYL